MNTFPRAMRYTALSVVVLLTLTFAVSGQEEIDRAVTYGKVKDLPLPKTIIFSVGPDQLAADAEEWMRHGVSAFFLNNVAREWSSDIWAADGKPWTIGESDETLRKTKKGTELCRRLGAEVFLKVAFDNFLEWFNDTAWQRIDNNFRQFAIFARDSGCTGVTLDIEYNAKQYNYRWEGYTYQGYTRQDLFRKIQERMTRVMSIMYDEFPNMVFLTFPECGFSLGTAIHAAWIEEAARRNAPGGVHYCTESTYRNPDIRFMLANAAMINGIFEHVLSEPAQKYWQEKCSIATGIWPFGFDYQNVHSPGLPLDAFRQGYAGSLMVSSRYNWVYGHNSVEQLVGRKLDAYDGKPGLDAYLRVIAERQVITTPKYLRLAREVRRMKSLDTAKITGVTPALSFSGPDDMPSVAALPTRLYTKEETERAWKLALDCYHGQDHDMRSLYGTQTNWMLIGPFPNADPFVGHRNAYPPEKEIKLDAEYDGISGKARWQEHVQTGPLASVDFRKVFQPTEHVTAYALCYVTSPERRTVTIRLATNDAGKMWVGGKLVYDYPKEGTASLDRDLVTVSLPKGKTPILLKVSNGVNNWGFVFRITDAKGKTLNDLTFSLR